MKNQTTQRSTELRVNSFSELFNEEDPQKRPASITIGKSPEELYTFLSNPTNYRLFMKDIVEVTQTSDKIFHWRSVKANGDEKEWDTEIFAQHPGQMLAWKFLGDPKTEQKTGAFTIEKHPGGRGSIVRLKVAHEHLSESIIGWAASIVGQNQNFRAVVDLKRLKAYLETGECPTIDGQANGKDAPTLN